ncbi:unnamed protein product [Schistosoma bovis]|uniref:Uncharacterized protein n=1 Tax=Schistosoma bovis TaxID=6184 RepID=A0A430QEB0_SCHBO|nr:uncharacterized protein DC041_0004888 [Schistosoma bovis]CAH8448616.1 unnamed protein product [Schistosoma bovis]CAH8449499.1 unnamed protein product [Schistosoma bovis]
MNSSVSSDISDQHGEEILNSGENKLDWRLKACELLEQHIEEIKLNNTNLVLESCVLASCLRDLLVEVESLKTSSVVNSLDDEKIVEYLLHYQSVISFDELVDSNLLSFTEAKYSTKESNNLSHCTNSKNPSLGMHEIRVVQDNVKQTCENVSSVSNIHANDNRPSLYKRSSAGHIDEENIDCDDPELIRSAFRLFAKHIGPSLKREYRTAFNAPPTQDWLAEQLLSRWDELSASEKFTWRKRVKST